MLHQRFYIERQDLAALDKTVEGRFTDLCAVLKEGFQEPRVGCASVLQESLVILGRH